MSDWTHPNIPFMMSRLAPTVRALCSAVTRPAAAAAARRSFHVSRSAFAPKDMAVRDALNSAMVKDPHNAPHVPLDPAVIFPGN
jgi:hypothetical protein